MCILQKRTQYGFPLYFLKNGSFVIMSTAVDTRQFVKAMSALEALAVEV